MVSGDELSFLVLILKRNPASISVIIHQLRIDGVINRIPAPLCQDNTFPKISRFLLLKLNHLAVLALQRIILADLSFYELSVVSEEPNIESLPNSAINFCQIILIDRLGVQVGDNLSNGSSLIDLG